MCPSMYCPGMVRVSQDTLTRRVGAIISNNCCCDNNVCTQCMYIKNGTASLDMCIYRRVLFLIIIVANLNAVQYLTCTPLNVKSENFLIGQ